MKTPHRIHCVGIRRGVRIQSNCRLGLAGLVTTPRGIRAIFTVTETVIGSEDRLGLSTPEVAVSGGFFTRRHARIGVEPLGEQLTTTGGRVFENVKFFGHGLQTSFQHFGRRENGSFDGRLGQLHLVGVVSEWSCSGNGELAGSRGGDLIDCVADQ